MDEVIITKTYTIDTDGYCDNCECEYKINDHLSFCIVFECKLNDKHQCKKCKDYLERKRWNMLEIHIKD